jgi:hypothetical protein
LSAELAGWRGAVIGKVARGEIYWGALNALGLPTATGSQFVAPGGADADECMCRMPLDVADLAVGLRRYERAPLALRAWADALLAHADRLVWVNLAGADCSVQALAALREAAMTARCGEAAHAILWRGVERTETAVGAQALASDACA